MCFGHDGEGALLRSIDSKGADRRTFLRGMLALGAGGAAVGAGAAPAFAGSGSAAAAGRRVPRGLISIQLYTLRSAMTDWDSARRVLRQLADIGYPRVELAGLYGQDARTVARFLRRQGIQPTSSHVGISETTAGLATKLEDAVTLGHEYIVVPYLSSDSADQWRTWAEQMNAEAALARSYGLRYGYHNHAHEFTTEFEDGSTPWQILTETLDPRLVHLEVDLYWAVTGGVGVGAADPVQFAIDVIHDAPQMVLQYHVKDRHSETSATPGDMADLGTGTIDFARIFAEHTVREYIVENDTPDVTPLQTAEVGYEYLRQLRF
jgi:sugar phosphate isomerase/epimerase